MCSFLFIFIRTKIRCSFSLQITKYLYKERDENLNELLSTRHIHLRKCDGHQCQSRSTPYIQTILTAYTNICARVYVHFYYRFGFCSASSSTSSTASLNSSGPSCSFSFALFACIRLARSCECERTSARAYKMYKFRILRC